MANFIRVSEKFLVLWSPQYFERLWCVYEMASFFHFKTLQDMDFFPAHRSQIFFSIIGFTTCCSIVLDIAIECGVIGGLNNLIEANNLTISAIMLAIFGFLFIVCWPFWTFLIYPKLVRASETHGSLEKQLRNFKCDNAKCHLDEDRHYIYAQIVKWFKPTAQLHKYTFKHFEFFHD